MSKITFRADDDLVEAVEELDASKSEVMRDALRSFLEADQPARATESLAPQPRTEDLENVVEERVDTVLADRLPPQGGPRSPQDVNLHITVDSNGTTVAEQDEEAADVGDPLGSADACAQCGEPIDNGHVYCPNCGEKATQRVFCECGDEVRADWSFCPHCGRRTTSADVLDR